jgi:hydrogenase nickel incorporation protein HypA/HybF
MPRRVRVDVSKRSAQGTIREVGGPRVRTIEHASARCANISADVRGSRGRSVDGAHGQAETLIAEGQRTRVAFVRGRDVSPQRVAPTLTTSTSASSATCRLCMHELSIAMSLVELASEEAMRLGAARVNALFVRVGSLSGIAVDALRFSFDLAAEGSIVAGARLELEAVDGGDLQLRALEVMDGVAADR